MASEIYRRLRRHLDRMPVAFPPTASGVEIRILERLFTPEEAAIALELSAVPEPSAAIHKRLPSRMDHEALVRALDRMAEKGVIHRFAAPSGVLYCKMMWAVGMYERQLSRLTPEFVRDSRQYMDEAFYEAFHTGKTTQMRVVPVNRTIPLDRPVASYQDIRDYVAAHPGPFGKMSCICRAGKRLLGEECVQTREEESCLTFGRAAALMAERGDARLIGRQDMLDLLDRAGRDGLVLQPENTQNPLFVCCCCHCCCGVLTSARRLPRPARYFTSAFRAAVDETSCQACGACQARCQMDAIRTDGAAAVDEARCIGCGLCVTTCPSGAMRLDPVPSPKLPPRDTPALYLQLLRERYGSWGMARIGIRKALGMKI